MENMDKKMAAALAAVSTFLQEEEICLAEESQSTTVPSASQAINLWALTGRQEMMSMRQLIQMKAFSRF